jgi:hypothetical protein
MRSKLLRIFLFKTPVNLPVKNFSGKRAVFVIAPSQQATVIEADSATTVIWPGAGV